MVKLIKLLLGIKHDRDRQGLDVFGTLRTTHCVQS